MLGTVNLLNPLDLLNLLNHAHSICVCQPSRYCSRRTKALASGALVNSIRSEFHMRRLYGTRSAMPASATASASAATSSKLPRDFLPFLIAFTHSSSGLVVSNSGTVTDPANAC